ncbi:MAG: SUMF1/EgtB/PvdO family nonheme iron enzyme [Anaerolineae bacterium]|nr:SUMF1/EgtB/PvdO family nonheme iron enzyme [Anaerolineae bacterium]
MSKIFISYSRKNIDAANFIAGELRNRGADVFIDYQSIQAGEEFPDRLATEIDSSDVIIFLLSENSVVSRWVRNEVYYAYQQNKLIIPVELDETPLPRNLFFLNAIDRVNFKDWGHGQSSETGLRKLLRALGFLEDESQSSVDITPYLPNASVRSLPQIKSLLKRRFSPGVLVGGIVLILLIATFAFIVAWQNQLINLPLSSEPSATNTESFDPIVAARSTRDHPLTQTAETFTDTPFPTATATYNITQTMEAAGTFVIEELTITAAFWTDTPIPPASPTLTFLELAQYGVVTNTDWQPYIQTFDDIEMVLVPAGCFDMGNNNGENDEKPVVEQCFDKPFWLDRTEVTNKQYGSEGSFSGDNHPRERVTWNEARAFCEAREARLPTEAEWEYAARGPDGWLYPWGNAFQPNNVVYAGNSNGQTSEVGSRLTGASWVGALDMSGNVWEWVNTFYEPYPYTSDDGREVLNVANNLRVVRGGSWQVTDSLLRSTYRNNAISSSSYNVLGFRCARDY